MSTDPQRTPQQIIAAALLTAEGEAAIEEYELRAAEQWLARIHEKVAYLYGGYVRGEAIRVTLDEELVVDAVWEARLFELDAMLTARTPAPIEDPLHESAPERFIPDPMHVRAAGRSVDPLHETVSAVRGKGSTDSASGQGSAKGLQSPAREEEEETEIERLTELLREAYPYLPMAVSLAEELAEMFPDIARPQDK